VGRFWGGGLSELSELKNRDGFKYQGKVALVDLKISTDQNWTVQPEQIGN
jgi:hypothetical protein